VDKEQAQELTQRLSRRTVEVISPAELTAKLADDRPLRIKLGMDPTAPDLHLGHTITLKAMRDFQNAGHTVVFLVGDFTAAIGDPSGRSETRKPLEREQIQANAESYKRQVFKILDPARTEIRFNSEWMDGLGLRELINIAAHISVARLLERDDFEQRLEAEQPLFLHELLYPLIQGYDSVAIRADVELGGTDQKFNMLLGRELQRAHGQPPQVVMTFPLLEGLDGVRKMSKSLGNYVGISETPSDMFGKLMSLSDAMMWPYFDLVTDRTPEEIAALADEVKAGAKHPMDVKMSLAREIIAGFHGEAAAEKAAAEFQRVFRDREAPQEMKEIVLKRLPMGISVRSKSGSTMSSHMATGLSMGPEKWSKVLAYLGEASSASEAERLMKQGGFEVNGSLVKDPTCKVDLNQPNSYEVRVGKKKFLRIVVE
jgi:tyrosyl-tRNA synthetase